MKRPLLITALFVLITVTRSDAAKILAMFPTPSVSHQIVFRPLTQELAKRGHEVVVITTDPSFPKGKTPANLTEIDVHDLSYQLWRDHFLETTTGRKQDLTNQMKVAFDVFAAIFEKQIQTKEVQEILHKGENHYDLLLLEACVRPALVLSHVFKAPVIQISSFGRIFENYEVIGAPTHPILYPSSTRQRIYNLTFWEKVTELYNHYSIQSIFKSHENEENEMIKRNFGPNVPTLSELSNNVDMLFLNVHPIFEGNYPVPPTVIHMWGLHQKPEKELPKDIKSYLDSSKHGVIYMSFGTNTNTSMLPSETIQIFVKVFSQMPYDILWKWDGGILPGQSKNIRTDKWFPQSDILRHPKVKLFITQGGLQSTDEAITAGVPLIGIPMLADQWHNTEKYVYHNIGVKLDLGSLTEELLRNSMNVVIDDESYRRNIDRLRALFLDQPQSALQRAAWWAEHALRHGGARHLRAPAANISWAQYLELELVLTLLIGFITIAIVFITILYFLFKYISLHFLSSDKLKVK